MRFKTGFLIGLGAGYVLGAKAGRERYQQIVEATHAFLDNPGVQRLTEEVSKTVSIGKDRVSNAASRRVEQVSDSQVDQRARAAQHGQHDEEHPDQRRVRIENRGQAAAHAGHLAIGAAAVQLAGCIHGAAFREWRTSYSR